MNMKTVGTVIMLAFVAVSVGYLILDETKSADTGDIASGQETSQTAPEGDQTAPEGDQTVSEGELVGAKVDPHAPVAETEPPAHKVVAYYFHNTQRCMTCNKIERLAEEALREQFAAALKTGELDWRVVNMEEPPNTHFVEDYQLVASSLVLIDMHDGKQRDWTNMEKVWEYVHESDAQFKQYVAEQVRKYLEPQS